MNVTARGTIRLTVVAFTAMAGCLLATAIGAAAAHAASTLDAYFGAYVGRAQVTDLESGSESIVKAFGSGGTSDPLNQRATAGWKMAFVARILNDNFIQLLQVTHS